MTRKDDTQLVTGAFGYSGSFISRELLARGKPVRTLTKSTARAHPLRGRVEVHPLDFEDEGALESALSGVRVLHNTYWVRFPKAGFSQDLAVRNSIRLSHAARKAGVERIVHISITHPSKNSPYSYFRGKAAIEEGLLDSAVPCSILRPAVLFGGPEILHNNIAWVLRHLPLFGLFGDGSYRLRPIHVEDLARLSADCADHSGTETLDAIGPEAFSFRELVTLIGEAIGRRPRFVRVPVGLGLVFLRTLGLFLRDVILTKEEVQALMDGLLDSPAESTGSIVFREWLAVYKDVTRPALGLRTATSRQPPPV